MKRYDEYDENRSPDAPKAGRGYKYIYILGEGHAYNRPYIDISFFLFFSFFFFSLSHTLFTGSVDGVDDTVHH